MRNARQFFAALALAGLVLGILFIVGPGTQIHHQLHKWEILSPCGCRGTNTDGCEWIGKPEIWQSWWGHHRTERREGIVLIGVSLTLAGAFWVGERTRLIHQ